jgi:hypothetical protein
MTWILQYDSSISNNKLLKALQERSHYTFKLMVYLQEVCCILKITAFTFRPCSKKVIEPKNSQLLQI